MTPPVTRRVVAGIAGLALAQIPMRLMAQTRITSPGVTGGGGGSAPSIGGGITGGTTGSVLFVGPGSTIAQDNAQFFWDDTFNRLSLGGQSNAKLTIIGTIDEPLLRLRQPAAPTANIIQMEDSAGVTVFTLANNGSLSKMNAGDFILAAATSSVAFYVGGAERARVTATYSLDTRFGAGPIRLKNNSSLLGVNAAGSGDVVIGRVNTSDLVELGPSAQFILAATTVTVKDAVDYVFSTGTGTRHGTATTQKQSFYGVTPVDQPATVADPAGGAFIDAESRTAIIAIIDRLQELGLVA